MIFSSQKHGEIAEVTVNARHHTVVGLSEAPDLTVALRTALDKAEKQAIRWKKTRVENKRHAEPISAVLPVVSSGEQSPSAPNGVKKSTTLNGKSSNPKKAARQHDVHSLEAVMQRPRVTEGAVKEAEFGD